MSELPDESVHCVTTSPPYWALRKYEGDQDLIWGGDFFCEHEWGIDIPHPMSKSGAHGPNSVIGAKKPQHEVRKQANLGSYCQKCGAWKGQFGLEPTPELYVQHTIEILREIKRVLRKDGVCFYNLGDSYASGKGTCFNPGGGANSLGKVRKEAGAHPLNRGNISDLRDSGLKPKDLCLIPSRVAIAAQEDGGWIRSVIIWEKLNPMPESVNGWRWEKHRIRVDDNGNRVKKGGKLVDCPGCETCLPNDGLVLRKGSWRPTNSYEFILMLTKSDDYYCDADAVREKYTEPLNRWGGDSLKRDTSKTTAYKEMQNIGYSSAFRVGRPMRPNENGRNLRDVWTFPTTPFPSQFVEGEKLDHFAVFPEKLPELCIKAATSEKGCCPKCGAPWARVIKKHGSGPGRKERKNTAIRLTRIAGQEWQDWKGEHPNETTGWKPTCNCGIDNPTACTVLDPFVGSGTTLLVATRLGRKSIGYDISESYCKMTVNRNRQGAL